LAIGRLPALCIFRPMFTISLLLGKSLGRFTESLIPSCGQTSKIVILSVAKDLDSSLRFAPFRMTNQNYLFDGNLVSGALEIGGHCARSFSCQPGPRVPAASLMGICRALPDPPRPLFIPTER